MKTANAQMKFKAKNIRKLNVFSDLKHCFISNKVKRIAITKPWENTSEQFARSATKGCVQTT